MRMSIFQALLGLYLSWKQKFESTRVGKVWLLFAAKCKVAEHSLTALALSFAALLGAMYFYELVWWVRVPQDPLIEAFVFMYLGVVPRVLWELWVHENSGASASGVDGSSPARILGIPAHRAYRYKNILFVMGVTVFCLKWLSSWGLIAWVFPGVPIQPWFVTAGLVFAHLMGFATTWWSVAAKTAHLRLMRAIARALPWSAAKAARLGRHL